MREYEETETEQAPDKGKRAGILILLGVILLCGGVYLYLNREPVIISPISPPPNYEVIFMTPTPTVEAPTETPPPTGGPTPKGGKAPTATPTKKVSASATPAITSKASVTPTPTVTATPTVKITATPTP